MMHRKMVNYGSTRFMNISILYYTDDASPANGVSLRLWDKK